MSLDELIATHHRPLLGYLYHMLNGDLMLAEDMVQEAFLRMIRTHNQYDSSRPFKPWLYAIATNLVRDYYKRADTRHTVMMPDTDWQDENTSPEAHLIHMAETHAISTALQALPLHFREAVFLRYYHEMSHQEIAETLGIPVGTVKSRLSNGLRQLKSLMED